MSNAGKVTQSPSAYSRVQVVLHWVIFVLMAAQYLLHGGIEAAWEGRLDGSLPNEPFRNPHVIVGIIILALAIWRVVLRLRLGAPALPEEEPQTFKLVAKVTHLAFYVILLAMPISGALAWLLGWEAPADAHEVAAKVMLALIILHVLGALGQQIVLKTDVMKRMSPKNIFRPDTSKDALS
ncbi:MAG: cytochrome b/b6 domain-containing protein [Roseobacter sp.]|jgi:cytochrome b561|nr:cytochrome b/b6 domain-containing protein [Roseobacter sp.]